MADGTSMPLPAALVEVLGATADGLADGHSMTVLSADVTLTPAEVAELLGVSRPFVVRLLDDGEIPSTRLPRSRHRRIRLADVIEFQVGHKRRRAGRYRVRRCIGSQPVADPAWPVCAELSHVVGGGRHRSPRGPCDAIHGSSVTGRPWIHGRGGLGRGIPGGIRDLPVSAPIDARAFRLRRSCGGQSGSAGHFGGVPGGIRPGARRHLCGLILAPASLGHRA